MNNAAAFNPQHILCPVDFSDLSILALKYAVAGARLYGSKLTILHSESLEVPRYFSRTEADRFGEELANAKKMITKDLADLVVKDLGKRTEGLDVQYQVTEANPEEAILQEAEKGNVDLIVMGTHGLSGFKRMLLGSTTESVLHEARVPTFIVRQKQHEIIDVRNADVLPHVERILCAIEMNDLDRTVLDHAVAVAERFNGKLTVLYSDESKGDKNQLRVKETLCDWVAGMAKAQCDLEPIVRKGGAADQIITYAEEEKSDLIVIGVRRKAFHDSKVLGRTTDLIVRHAPAPVLVVPGLL